MPARYWLPLQGLQHPVPVEHLHAALSGWFDHVIAEDRVQPSDPQTDPHDFAEKPYTISPATHRDSVWGIEVTVMGRRTEQELLANSTVGARLRLGKESVTAAPAVRLSGATWRQLRDYDGSTGWAVELVTPFTMRTGNRHSPFPLPSAVLRAPSTVWRAYCGLGPVEIPRNSQGSIWVSSIDVETTIYTLKGRAIPGLLGEVVYRCDDPAVAPAVSTLLRFAEFSGAGSFRGKGMGIVTVRSI